MARSVVVFLYSGECYHNENNFLVRYGNIEWLAVLLAVVSSSCWCAFLLKRALRTPHCTPLPATLPSASLPYTCSAPAEHVQEREAGGTRYPHPAPARAHVQLPRQQLVQWLGVYRMVVLYSGGCYHNQIIGLLHPPSRLPVCLAVVFASSELEPVKYFADGQTNIHTYIHTYKPTYIQTYNPTHKVTGL